MQVWLQYLEDLKKLRKTLSVALNIRQRRDRPRRAGVERGDQRQGRERNRRFHAIGVEAGSNRLPRLRTRSGLPSTILTPQSSPQTGKPCSHRAREFVPDSLIVSDL